MQLGFTGVSTPRALYTAFLEGSSLLAMVQALRKNNSFRPKRSRTRRPKRSHKHLSPKVSGLGADYRVSSVGFGLQHLSLVGLAHLPSLGDPRSLGFRLRVYGLGHKTGASQEKSLSDSKLGPGCSLTDQESEMSAPSRMPATKRMLQPAHLQRALCIALGIHSLALLTP